ncbi:hypothetical protein DFA_07110 [Cavenderia fasciculata]|uniref:Complex 1 LYR protein domain-containing protein n=1 Tax=Cavenderia fasciculata TaxID=261658 RepID=F4PVI1_CACFS|nr:uncharacterized protein DFA_07110 [Cavenderia fasciculata]EGG19995.1 hypothetical protein DFA_07110 [Cavenderia fasciculata]|eukprot:XP_004366978.1 hypothetical protein DFA_07110 [Cavenderia fasciculata]
MMSYTPSNCIHLYRDLLRAARLLLVDSARKDRSFSQVCRNQVRDRFRENKSVVDTQMKRYLFDQAQKEFSHLKSLLENDSLIKYPNTIRVLPEAAKKSKILLSTSSQEKIKSKKWGLIDRVISTFTNNK